MTNRIFELSDDEFIKLIKSSTCIKGVLFVLGYTTAGNSWGYSQVKQRMDILNLNASDFKGRSALQGVSNRKLDNNKLFSEHDRHPRSIVRRRIIKENLLEYKCAICGLNKWNGKTLSLELDHINGINTDNRLENLRFLCPNCHSQTSTYGSKNKDVSVAEFEITPKVRSDIEQEFLLIPNIKKVSQKTGYKYKVVKEVVSELGLTKPHLKHVIRYDKDYSETQRFESISQACCYLIENNVVKTKRYKTCRATFLRNCNKFWLNSYWKILDA